MNVLILAPRLPHSRAYSGMQTVYQRMRLLLQRGYGVGLCCYTHPEDEAYQHSLPSELIDVQMMPGPLWNRMLPGSFTKGRYSTPSSFFRFHSERMRQRVGEQVQRHQYDVVLAEFSAMGYCFMHNPWLPAVRRMISCHDSPALSSRRRLSVLGSGYGWAKQWLEYRHMRYMEFRLYHAADRVLTLTNEERLALLEEDPTLRIRCIPPGLRSNSFEQMDGIQEEHCILITSRFDNEQSHFGVLWFLRNVWPLLRRRDPQLKVYLVGKNPSSVMQHIAKRDNRVIVTGWVEDLRPFLAKCKVYVCPVRTGSGIRGKILEAMAMEKPVVSTTIAAEGIAVDQGSNAFLADAPPVMADLIYMLLHDPEKRKVMGHRARNLVEHYFTWDQSMDMLETTLHELVAKRSYHVN